MDACAFWIPFTILDVPPGDYPSLSCTKPEVAPRLKAPWLSMWHLLGSGPIVPARDGCHFRQEATSVVAVRRFPGMAHNGEVNPGLDLRREEVADAMDHTVRIPLSRGSDAVGHGRHAA